MKIIIPLILLALLAFSCNKNDNKDNETQKPEVELKAESQVSNTSATEVSVSSQRENQKDSIKTKSNEIKSNEKSSEPAQRAEKPKYPLITFIELGSVNCIPCKRMQPIMKSLEEKYGEQLKVIFYDVWKTEFKPKASEYKIKLIPTQVFLDQSGNEIHRHEGFYPEEEIDKFLSSKGLKIINKGEK